MTQASPGLHIETEDFHCENTCIYNLSTHHKELMKIFIKKIKEGEKSMAEILILHWCRKRFIHSFIAPFLRNEKKGLVLMHAFINDMIWPVHYTNNKQHL